MSRTVDIEQPEALLAYLRNNGRIATDEPVAMRPLSGGVSNRVVLVERPNGAAWVIKQALAKLRVAVDWFSDPRRIEREAAGLRCLMRVAPHGSITPLEWEDAEQHMLAMRAVPAPHSNWKTLLLAGQVDVAAVRQFGRLLGTIHRNAYASRAQIEPLFTDRSFFESLRIEPYYRYTAAQVSQAAHFYRELIDETESSRLTLVHGDYSPKNVLVHRETLVLLDHEVIHWGDPAFDVGFSMTHLLSKAHHVTGQRATFADAALRYWHAYRDALGDVPWGSEVEARAVRHTLGCLLARVAGRSPLEYLRADERDRQQQIVVELLGCQLADMTALVGQFVARVDRHDRDRTA